jgi:shikimate dehydrogenase
MAKAVACAFRDAGFRSGHIIARNEGAGRALAHTCGYEWHSGEGDVAADLIVNVTPIGMAGGAEADELSFDARAVEGARAVFDVVAIPPETPLVRLARARGKKTITGLDVIAIQALEQFVLYTGFRPTDEQVGRAAAFART